MRNILKKWSYVVTILIIVLVLCIIYRNANLMYPLMYDNGDNMGVYYLVKTIRDYGIALVNPMVGGITGGDMYDYIYSDTLSFIIVKFLSFFVSDIYLLTNMFYFSCFVLIGISSHFVCKRLQFSNGISILISVLYAFSPYIQLRYAHMWLVPYFMLPLSCYVAILIAKGELITHECIWKDKRFYKVLFISLLCANTGFYYAFFTCILYAMAMIFRLINVNRKEIVKNLYPIWLIVSVAIGCVMNIIPNVLYWLENGQSPNSEYAIRTKGDAEFYGLKFIQMVLPRGSHRVEFLRELTAEYNGSYPLVNENSTATIGIIATIGFLISVIWLFNNHKKDKTLSYFNIGVFAVATIGGVGSLFSLLVSTPMRCYNRMSLIIMFFSLLCVATILEEVKKRIRPKAFGLLLGGVLLFGLYDQTVDYVPWDYANLESDREFVNEIEEELAENDMVYQLPYVNWPSGGNYRMFVGYLESDDLHWSHGAIQGREESQWQQSMVSQAVPDMINGVVDAGYDGIYLDKLAYLNMYTEQDFETLQANITNTLGYNPLISDNQMLYFWTIQ